MYLSPRLFSSVLCSVPHDEEYFLFFLFRWLGFLCCFYPLLFNSGSSSSSGSGSRIQDDLFASIHDSIPSSCQELHWNE